MALFNTLEQAIAGGGQIPVAAGGPQSVIASVIQMVQDHPGGIDGLVGQFESAGLGGVARSWLAAGANQPVSAGQVQAVLGAGPVDKVAQQLGVSNTEASGHIAQYLPLLLDHLSPGGQSAGIGGGPALSGLLQRLGAA